MSYILANEKPMTKEVAQVVSEISNQVLLWSRYVTEECNRYISTGFNELSGEFNVFFWERTPTIEFEIVDYFHVGLRENELIKRTVETILSQLKKLLAAMEKFHNGEEWKNE